MFSLMQLLHNCFIVFLNMFLWYNIFSLFQIGIQKALIIKL